MYGSQKCCGELAELTVDEIWQIADAGDQELRRLHTVVGEVPWSSVPKVKVKVNVDLYSALS